MIAEGKYRQVKRSSQRKHADCSAIVAPGGMSAFWHKGEHSRRRAAKTFMGKPPRSGVVWSELIPSEDWARYRTVIKRAAQERIPFALGGGLAFSSYAPRARNTKDLDLFIKPANKERLLAILGSEGFEDYYERESYDRSWIYRGFKDGSILDVIWTMPNHRFEVSEEWVTLGDEVEIHGDLLRLLPPEELLQSKLYVLQHDRCDWPDLMNILFHEGASLDWNRLISNLGRDRVLLAGLLSTYSWMCPHKACEIPDEVWDELGIRDKPDPFCPERERAFLLDTRDWFGPHQKEGEKC